MSYDLEEQDQIDQLRAFWQRWGGWLSLLALLAALAWAGSNAWRWWNDRQAVQAAQIADRLQLQLQQGHFDAAAPLWALLQHDHASSPYSATGGLSLARAQLAAGQLAVARQTLGWVAAHAGDASYRAVADLDLAALQIDAGELPQALQTVQQTPSPAFAPLFAMRRGDIHALQGDLAAARGDYHQALDQLQPDSAYRSVLQLKLLSVGGQA